MEADVPADVAAEKGWRCLRVAGTIPFTEIGVLASLTAILSEARISVFVISTYDTDLILVKQNDLAAAIESLERGGHEVRNES
jgi:hypothetical protein